MMNTIINIPFLHPDRLHDSYSSVKASFPISHNSQTSSLCHASNLTTSPPNQTFHYHPYILFAEALTHFSGRSTSGTLRVRRNTGAAPATRPADCLCVLVGNKLDFADKRQVSAEEADEYRMQMAADVYFETSALNGQGMKEMFEKIATMPVLVFEPEEPDILAAVNDDQSQRPPSEKMVLMRSSDDMVSA
jgi:hypothetical protein